MQDLFIYLFFPKKNALPTSPPPSSAPIFPLLSLSVSGGQDPAGNTPKHPLLESFSKPIVSTQPGSVDENDFLFFWHRDRPEPFTRWKENLA